MRAALYVRVSTDDQDLDHQEHDLRRELERRGWVLGVRPSGPGDSDAVFRETVSGAAAKRPELETLRELARRRYFDTVLVWSISRLGRNALEVLRIAEELRELGIGLASYREPAVDTSGSMGRLVLQVWAAIAEFERAELVAQTRSGMAGAKRRGVHIGRPRSKATPQHVAYLVENGNPPGKVAKLLGVSRATVYRLLELHRTRNPGTLELKLR